MYEMKPEFFTGIELVDTEHARLFELANEAYELMQDDFTPDKYDYILSILNSLNDYAKQHFKDEEAYMESIQYKRLFTQKIEHQAFISKLEEFDLESIDENQEQAILSILTFLNDWLVQHILEKDLLIGK
ncbi:bacteriohemerythrin [Anaerobium acetethylicum]|uniref:Hemerythrin n=1 Tax=Anaerobium acetethylicum TaxID=1619234 RepID=A0A1D3TXQ3_9FIRM|nr:hemerythrin family protein [Anaerobium acetethylicum]SCP99119.1 hemerythrin [Anaerobium acetethylicum]